jgi:hypothetical protein
MTVSSRLPPARKLSQKRVSFCLATDDQKTSSSVYYFVNRSAQPTIEIEDDWEHEAA